MRTATDKAKPCPIIVLGAERSGTSVVTEMVHKWGAYAGEPENLTKADKHNPQGYWEYSPIWDFLAELGEFASGVSWWDASFPDHLRRKLSVPYHRDKALALISDMEKAGTPWVWKDPALSFFLPFWQEIWGNAAYIITVRNPYNTACSWQRFVLPPAQHGEISLVASNLLRWQYMMLQILEHTEEIQTKIFIPYEGVVQEPQQQARRLYAFLNKFCHIQRPDETKIERMVEAVKSDLWHLRSARPFAQVEKATEAQKALYQFLKKKVHDPFLKVERAAYPMAPGWREFVRNGEALAALKRQKAAVEKTERGYPYSLRLPL